MIKVDENALICDLAETYHIYNYKQLPPLTVAIFCIGLRGDSRIKMKLRDSKVSTEILLLSGILDGVNLLLWAKTEDGRKGRSRPRSMVDIFTGKKDESKISAFTSGEDFERERQRLMKGGN